MGEGRGNPCASGRQIGVRQPLRRGLPAEAEQRSTDRLVHSAGALDMHHLPRALHLHEAGTAQVRVKVVGELMNAPRSRGGR